MKCINKEEGFTLIEMMIVLLIISVLVLIAIPNVTKHSQSIDEKGCKAYVKMVEGQIAAYKMDHHKYPDDIDGLKDYLPKGASCPDGRTIIIENGVVTEPKFTETSNGNSAN